MTVLAHYVCDRCRIAFDGATVAEALMLGWHRLTIGEPPAGPNAPPAPNRDHTTTRDVCGGCHRALELWLQTPPVVTPPGDGFVVEGFDPVERETGH